MPTAPPSRCTQPQCGNFATYEGRCEDHRRRPWGNVSARNTILDPGLWQRTARAHLTHEPACRACGSTDGLQVDHIREIADGGEPYDDNNLQTLCFDHHREKTRIAKQLRKDAQAAADLEQW